MMYDVAGPRALAGAVAEIEAMFKELVEDGFYTTDEVEIATCEYTRLVLVSFSFLFSFFFVGKLRSARVHVTRCVAHRAK